MPTQQGRGLKVGEVKVPLARQDGGHVRVGESRSFYSSVTSGGRTVDMGEKTKRPVCASGGAGGALKNAPSIESESAGLHAFSRDNRCTAITKRPRILSDADGALGADRLSHTVELAERNRGHEVISGM